MLKFNSLCQVRAYAVSVLERADDEELQCYLLQLVQALRFERSDKSRLSHFLVQRCMCSVLVNCLCMHEYSSSLNSNVSILIVNQYLRVYLLFLIALRNIKFASFLRWYVAVELYDPAYAKRFYSTYEILEENMIKV